MKNYAKNFLIIIAVLFTAIVASGAKIGDDVLTVGKPGSTDDKIINLGPVRQIRSNETNGLLEFTTNGINFKPLGSGSGGGSGVNLLSDNNGDFETGTPPDNWTASGGVFTADVATQLHGLVSGNWDSDASAQTLCSDAITIERGFIGGTCQAQIKYTYPVGANGDYKLVARDTGVDVAEVDFNLTVGSDSKPSTLTFPCPGTDTDTLQLCLESTVADADPIKIDSAFIGAGLSIVQAVPKNEIETKVLTANVTTNGIIAEFTYSNLEIGATYEIGGRLALFVNNGGVDTTIQVDIENGAQDLDRPTIRIADTGTSQDYVYLPISTIFTATDTTLTFTANSASGVSFIFGSSSRFDSYVQLEKRNDLGGNFQEGLTVETSGFFIKQTITGANINLGTATVASRYLSSGSLVLTNYGTHSAKLPCLSGPSEGLTCAGSGQYGTNFVADTSGWYKVCTQFTTRLEVGASGAIQNNFTWNVVSNDGLNTELQNGVNLQQINNKTTTSAGFQEVDMSLPLCETFNFGSAGEKTLLMKSATTATATVAENLMLAGTFIITVEKLIQGGVQAAFTGITNSLSFKPESQLADVRICSFSVDNSGGTPILDRHDNCIDSVTDNGAGDWTHNFTSGTFSAPPSCAISSDSSNIQGICHSNDNSLSANQVRSLCLLSSTAGAADLSMSGICVGPK